MAGTSIAQDDAALAAENELVARALAPEVPQVTEDTSPSQLSDQQLNDPTIQQRIQLAAQKRVDQSAQVGPASVEMQDQNTREVSGRVVPGSPGGFNFSAYDTPGKGLEIGGEAPGKPPAGWLQSYMGEQGVPTDAVSPGRPGISLAASGQTNVMDKLSADERLSHKVAEEGVRKSEQDADDLIYAAKLTEDKARAEANLQLESDKKLRELEAKRAEVEKFENSLYKQYNTPAKVFHPATGGATGILGALAGISWALASPEYQKNTIAMANTLIEQDLRNREMEQKKLEGRIRSSTSLYERYRQQYKDDVVAKDAYKAHLGRSLADSMRAMAMKSQSAEVRERGLILADVIQNKSKSDAMETIAKFRTAPRAPQYKPYFVRNKEGKVIGRSLGGNMVGQVAEEKDLATTTIDNKAIGVMTGSAPERDKLMKTFTSLAQVKDMSSSIAQEAASAESITDPGQRAALLDSIAQRSLFVQGQLAKAAELGTMQEGDKKNVNDQVMFGASEVNKGLAMLRRNAEQAARGVSGVDDREAMERIAGGMRNMAKISDDLVKKEIGNRSTFQKHVEKAGNEVVGEGWIPTGQISVDVSGAGPMAPNVKMTPEQIRNLRAVQALKPGNKK